MAAPPALLVADWEGADYLPAPFNLFALPAHVLRLLGVCVLAPFLWCWRCLIRCLKKDVREDKTREEVPKEEMHKTLRMIKNGSNSWFGSLQHLEYLKDLIAHQLQVKMGGEATGNLSTPEEGSNCRSDAQTVERICSRV